MSVKYPLSEYFQLFSGKASEQNLRYNLAFMSKLLETVESLIVILDKKGRIVEFNPACERVSGYTRQEVLGKTPDFLIPAEERPGVTTVIENLLSDAVPANYENHWISKSGSLRMFVWSNNIVKDDAGNVASIICTGIDTTDLCKHTSRLRVILNILQVLATPMDLDSVLKSILEVVQDYLKCDAVGIRLRKGDDYPYIQSLGFSEDFLKTESLLCSYQGGIIRRAADGRALLECMCGRIIRGDLDESLSVDAGAFFSENIDVLAAKFSSANLPFRIRNHCGKAGYKSIALIPLQFQDDTVGLLQLNDCHLGKFNEDEVSFLTLVGQSIAAALVRFQAEQEQRKTQLILDKIIHKVRDGFSLGTQYGEFLIYNKAMEEITGYTEEEVNKHGWFLLIYPKEEERRQAVYKTRQALSGRLDLIATTITSKDGTRKPVTISVTPMEIEGKTFIFSTVIDLSPR